MAIQFRKRLIDDGRGSPEMVFDVDKPYELVGTFLYVEAEPFGDTILAALDKVLTGVSQYEEFSGNVCSLQIRNAATAVVDNLAQGGKGNSCQVGTGELKEMVLLWLAERNR